MRILLVTPAPPRSYHGNRVTAVRWAGILRSLGHQVRVRQGYDSSPADLLIALHARRSADAVRRARADRPSARIVLALTGTDLYPSLAETGADPDVLATADRLVVLQPLALEQVPAALRGRTRVIYQSVKPLAAVRYHAAEPPPVTCEPGAAPARGGSFGVALLAHLRPVKDPLLPARAARLLPASSPVRIWHAGAVIDPALGDRAAAETRANPRYAWLGELNRSRARELLAASHVLVHPSRHEGGANVVSEALAAGVPVLATRIPGTIGILGADYPGYFPVGDAAALAGLLSRVERDAGELYDELRRRCAVLRPRTDPRRERASWRRLLAELAR
jgi:putative glycosyltransferase (TIGR04348 family)